MRLEESLPLLYLQGVALEKKEEFKNCVIKNESEEPKQVQLEVKKNNDIILSDEYQLPPRNEVGSTVNVYEWENNNKANSWTVSAKTPDTDWVRGSFDVSAAPYCHWVEVTIGEWEYQDVVVGVNDCNITTGQ